MGYPGKKGEKVLYGYHSTRVLNSPYFYMFEVTVPPMSSESFSSKISQRNTHLNMYTETSKRQAGS